MIHTHEMGHDVWFQKEDVFFIQINVDMYSTKLFQFFNVTSRFVTSLLFFYRALPTFIITYSSEQL